MAAGAGAKPFVQQYLAGTEGSNAGGGVGEALAEKFMRCLQVCVAQQVFGLSSPAALREAVALALASMRGTSGAVALVSLDYTKSLLLLLPRCVGAKSPLASAAVAVMDEEGGGIAALRGRLSWCARAGALVFVITAITLAVALDACCRAGCETCQSACF